MAAGDLIYGKEDRRPPTELDDFDMLTRLQKITVLQPYVERAQALDPSLPALSPEIGSDAYGALTNRQKRRLLQDYVEDELPDGYELSEPWSHKLFLLRKVPDPESGAGSALRAEFIEEEIEELLTGALGLAYPQARPRTAVNYGGEIRTAFFPFGNADALLENVLWGEFSGTGNVSLANGSSGNGLLVAKTILDTDIEQVFGGVMVQEMSVELVRGEGEVPDVAQVVLSLSAMSYAVTEPDGADEIPLGPEPSTGDSQSDIQRIDVANFVAEGGAGSLDAIQDINMRSLSMTFRPDLREVRGLGSRAPRDFYLGVRPFECSGSVRFTVGEGSDDLLKKFLDQDVYSFTVQFNGPGRAGHTGYRFEFPRITFSQGWVVPREDEAGRAYNEVEWVALQDPENGVPAVKITKTA